MGSNDDLESLLRSGGPKAESPDHKECEGLLRSAIDRLQDAHNPALSFASRYRGLSPIVCSGGGSVDKTAPLPPYLLNPQVVMIICGRSFKMAAVGFFRI